MKNEKTLLDVITGDFSIMRGKPIPLGTSLHRDGINFSVFSKNATAVSLVVFSPKDHQLLAEFPLDPKINKTGHIWHALITGVDPGISYGYKMDKKPNYRPDLHRFNKELVLLDPYAKAISGGECWQEKKSNQRFSLIIDDEFDWEFEQPLNIPLSQTIIYEMHVRGFTQHFSSDTQYRGTFAGLTEKIPYLKDLGITAIELLPINEFVETEFTDLKNPLTQEPLINFWGYNSYGFFAPKASYAWSNKAGEQVKEFKTMVKKMHKAGIEVILDVVFNHTAEGNENGQIYNFRGIDNTVYYMLDSSNGSYLNYSGCGNTVNCNNPIVRDLILDCLRYWVTEMHIDGFRFDLASILGRDEDGTVLSNPPLIERIAGDPVLANTKIIAEAWDAAGLYQVGTFPAWGRWAEWNGKFRDDIRKFVKGDSGLLSVVSKRLLGSPDLYEANGRAPFHSINFITSHDGFTLMDLVSYNQKHNEANGENNRDGSDYNDSWNCGEEGESDKPEIISLRKKQMKNFATLLLLSSGVPMLLAGDELARTQKGNNNAYCHDNELSWLNWNLLDKNADQYQFFKRLISFRKENDLFRRETFRSHHIDWHGFSLFKPDWSDNSRSIALHLYADRESQVKGAKHIFIMINMHWETHAFQLPRTRGGLWHRVLDTHLESPRDMMLQGSEVKLTDQSQYIVNERSIVALIAKN